MSNQLQLRADLQNSILQWANTMMAQYGVSAAMIEDAINALLVKIKEQIMMDTLVEQMERFVQEQEQSETFFSTEGGEEDGNERSNTESD